MMFFMKVASRKGWVGYKGGVHVCTNGVAMDRGEVSIGLDGHRGGIGMGVGR